MGRAGIIVTGLVALALAVGAFMLMGNNDDTPQNNNQPSTSQNAPNDTQTDEATVNTASAATITFTDDGFSPSTLTVKSGDTIAVKNDSSSSLEFESNPH